MKNTGVWVGTIILICAGVIFWQSLSYDYYGAYGPGPGLFPLWLSGSLILVSFLYIIESIKNNVISIKEILPKGRGFGNVVSIFISLIIFLIIVSYTGYILAGIVMLFILFIRDYKWYWGLGISTIVTLTVYLSFETFLKVPLPTNSFGF